MGFWIMAVRLGVVDRGPIGPHDRACARPKPIFARAAGIGRSATRRPHRRERAAQAAVAGVVVRRIAGGGIAGAQVVDDGVAGRAGADAEVEVEEAPRATVEAKLAAPQYKVEIAVIAAK